MKALVMSVDVDVAGPGPCIEPGDGFLYMCFMSLIKVKEKGQIDYISGGASLP